MTNTELNIAIAEACGYERKPQHDAVWGFRGMKIFGASNLPKYTGSLAALLEAKQILESKGILNEYADLLKRAEDSLTK